MSLRRPAEGAEEAVATDGRSYRRSFHFIRVRRDREEAARKRREKPDNRVALPPGGAAPPSNAVPPDGPFPLANPRTDQWSITAVAKLWNLLTQGNTAVNSLAVSRWTIALNQSQPARQALGLPVPAETVSETSADRRRNRNYALRVFTEAAETDAGGSPTLTLPSLTRYLTRSPNPLGLLPLNDTNAAVRAGHLPRMFLRV